MRAVDLVPGVSLLALCSLGFLGMIPNEAFRTSLDLPVWNGDWGVKWEKTLDEHFVVRETSVTAWAIAEYALFQNGRPGVLVGEEGWLFSSEEFSSVANERSVVEANAKVAVSAAARIAERGAALLVVVVPAKTQIEEEHLGRYTVPEAVRARPAPFLAALRASGIDVLELEPALRQARASQQVFLRTDTHWTPAGAQAAASAISTHIRAKGADWVDSASVSVAEGPQSTHSGDLLRYIPLGPFQDSMGPRPDELRTPVYTVAAGGDLFGEASIPATLVGTSYSDDVRWGFLGALQLALGADVLNAAAQGKGPFVSMAAYLDDESWRSTPPKLVIWEIPERYLGVAYDLSAFRAINTAAPAEK